jgi:hypothetical protein
MELLSRKRLLFDILEKDPYREFTKEDELLLHSKHGVISIGKYSGITPAFTKGLPCYIYDVDSHNLIVKIPPLTFISWKSGFCMDRDDNEYRFMFTPLKLSCIDD